MAVTIRDIAKMANVSVATVSRVIHSNGYVKEETRNLIEKYIQETGYQKNRPQQRNGQHNYIIAVILPDILDNYCCEILQGIMIYAESQNFNIMVFSSNNDEEKELFLVHALKFQKIDGIIIFPVNITGKLPQKCIRSLEELKIPVSVVGRDMRYTYFDNIFMDEESGAFDAVSLLLRNGHERIGIICGDRTSVFMDQRYHGYENALINCGKSVVPDYVRYSSQTVEDAYQATDELLSLPTPPTAIFSTDIVYTLGLVKYLIDYHLSIGRELAVTAYGDIELLSVFKFNITTVVKKTLDMGKYAAELLIKKIFSGNKEDIIRAALIPELHIRGSEKPLTKNV